jgi:hypothetical protein
MESGQTVFLRSAISSSAFSGERVFRLALASGAEHVGITPVGYCLDQDRAPLGPHVPPKGHRINGFVEGRLLASGSDKAQVAIPDGEIVEVKFEELAFAISAKEEAHYVPVRP